MPRFFHIGQNMPPFSFTYSSTEYTIFPPDKRWKRVPKKIQIGVFPNGKIKEITQYVWEEDPAPQGRKPANFLDLTQDQAAYLCSGKFLEAREYIKTSEEIGKDQEQEEDAILAEHEAKMAQLKRKLEHEMAVAKSDHERQMMELAKQAPTPVSGKSARG